MYFVHPQIYLSKLASQLSNRANFSQKLAAYFPNKQVVFTDMGRSAFKIICEKLNLRNSELMMPAYICDIFKPILEKYNIRPIFLDIDLKTFHIKIEQISRKITPRTKAVIVCHTYGLPFDIEKIRKFNLLIIEDCAHSFGANVGNAGDAAIFSLYKQFPVLRGGALVCPRDWKFSLEKTFFNCRDFISFLNCFPVFAFLFKRFGSEIAYKIIRKEKLPEPAAINKISLDLFSRSLKDFEESLEERKRLALFFQQELKKLGFEVQESKGNVFCYLSAMVPKSLEQKRDEIVRELRKKGVFCVRIWKDPIVLDKKEFPNTFEAAKRIINFPLQNHYTEKDAERIIKALIRVMKSFNLTK